MKSFKTALIFGFLVWLVPFMVSFWIFPLKETQLALFESIMAVMVTISAVTMSILYLKRLEENYLREGVLVGLLWLGVSIVIDLFMFMWGPMKMGFIDYMKDIGLTYLIIPTVTIGFSYMLGRKRENKPYLDK